jgi:hypothetical protein
MDNQHSGEYEIKAPQIALDTIHDRTFYNHLIIPLVILSKLDLGC